MLANPATTFYWQTYFNLLALLASALDRSGRLTKRREGQDFLEYIVIVGLALLVVAAIGVLYGAINGLFVRAAATVGGLHF
jgi:Flp pilus assembly pilin Flp